MSSYDFQYLCHLFGESLVAKLSIHLKESLINELHSGPPLFPFLHHLMFCGRARHLRANHEYDFYIEHEDGIIWLGVYRSLLGLLPLNLKNGHTGYELRDFTTWELCDPRLLLVTRKSGVVVPQSWGHLVRTRFPHRHLKDLLDQ